MKRPSFTRNDTRGYIRQLFLLIGFSGWAVAITLLLTRPPGNLASLATSASILSPNTFASASGYKNLVFYNKPPKTGSTTVRIAMSAAAEQVGRVAAKCFQKTEWNELGLRTLIKREDVDFYGCHTRLFRNRFTDILAMRGGNVTFMTNTRTPDNIILSAYLQKNRHRDFTKVIDPRLMKQEIGEYEQYVSTYPISALYRFHGGEEPLLECPIKFKHENEMRMLAERYEIVVDLERPEESASIVQAITGLTPNFTMKFNERTTDLSSPMLAALASVDTSHRMCGNALVHKVLKQHYNIIKDRLIAHGCFDENDGTYANCDKVRPIKV